MTTPPGNAPQQDAGTDEPHNLDEVLDAVCKAAEPPEGASVGEILEAVGHRSYGPVFIVLALIAFTPLGGIPGIPTVLAVVTIAVATQLTFGVGHIWLPQFVLHRRMSREGLRKAERYLRPVARTVDRFVRPRLTWLFAGTFVRGAALGCVMVALTVPPLEIVPFAGSVSWAAIGTFGLAIIARDGILMLAALAFAFGAAGVLAWTFL